VIKLAETGVFTYRVKRVFLPLTYAKHRNIFENQKLNMKAECKNNDHLSGKVINMGDASELKYWCQVLQCEKEDLVSAMQRIGNSAKMVDDFLVLNRRKKTDNGK
jgi:hypothetical protein